MALSLLVWLALGVFAAGCAWRALRYARAPEHLRWDLYPVAHEPRRDHGGSYFEEKDWWTRPRKVDRLGEVALMLEEVVLLRGVWRNNRRLWGGSLPFHWGLYLLVLTTLGLLASALGVWDGALLGALAVAGAAGGALLAAGSLVLLGLRASDPRLRPYTAPVDLANLGLLAVLGGLSLAVAAGSSGMAPVSAAVADVLRLRPATASPLLAAQMTVASVFLLYFPATRMVHLFAKYFLYHDVRWNDRPREAGSALDRRLRAALDYGLTWSAPHVRTGETWSEVATRLPVPKSPGGRP